MDFTGEIAKQGFGYLLAMGEFVVIVFLFRKYTDTVDRRINDLTQTRDTIATNARDTLNSLQNLQNSVNMVVTILDKVRTKK